MTSHGPLSPIPMSGADVEHLAGLQAPGGFNDFGELGSPSDEHQNFEDDTLPLPTNKDTFEQFKADHGMHGHSMETDMQYDPPSSDSFAAGEGSEGEDDFSGEHPPDEDVFDYVLDADHDPFYSHPLAFELCEKSTKMDISHVEYDMISDEEVELSIFGMLNEQVTAGKYDFGVALHGIKGHDIKGVEHISGDLCKLSPRNFSCPAGPGPVTLSKTFSLPPFAVQEAFNITVKAHDISKQVLFCVSVEINFDTEAEASQMLLHDNPSPLPRTTAEIRTVTEEQFLEVFDGDAAGFDDIWHSFDNLLRHFPLSNESMPDTEHLSTSPDRACIECIYMSTELIVSNIGIHLESRCKEADYQLPRSHCRWALQHFDVVLGFLIERVRPVSHALSFCSGRGVCQAGEGDRLLHEDITANADVNEMFTMELLSRAIEGSHHLTSLLKFNKDLDSLPGLNVGAVGKAAAENGAHACRECLESTHQHVLKRIMLRFRDWCIENARSSNKEMTVKCNTVGQHPKVFLGVMIAKVYAYKFARGVCLAEKFCAAGTESLKELPHVKGISDDDYMSLFINGDESDEDGLWHAADVLMRNLPVSQMLQSQHRAEYTCEQCVALGGSYLVRSVVDAISASCKYTNSTEVIEQCKSLSQFEPVLLGYVVERLKPVAHSLAFCSGLGTCKVGDSRAVIQQGLAYSGKDAAIHTLEAVIETLESDPDMSNLLVFDGSRYQFEVAGVKAPTEVEDGSDTTKPCLSCIKRVDHHVMEVVMGRVLQRCSSVKKFASKDLEKSCKWIDDNQQYFLGSVLAKTEPYKFSSGYCTGLTVCHAEV